MRSSYELARQIAELLVAQSADDAELGGNLATDFSVEVAVGAQIYAVTCRHMRPQVSALDLSPREREVVRLVALGLPNKAIAQVLEISLWTVATYIRRVFAKLGVTTRAQMVAKIVREGLVDLEGRAGPPHELGLSPIQELSELRRMGGYR